MKTKTLPNIHPGEVLLEEFLLPVEISQNALARATGVPPRRINEIVLGKRGITADTALGDDRFDFVLCNPPFHASARAAEAAALRKWKNLGKPANPESNPKLNFGGQAAELWCEGGEVGFVCRMVAESAQLQTQHRAQVSWFSALVSREENLPEIYSALKAVGARRVETIAMAQGQKKSRIVAWHFGKNNRQH